MNELQLDVLSNGNSLHEVAHIANGSHQGNCISLLRINVRTFLSYDYCGFRVVKRCLKNSIENLFHISNLIHTASNLDRGSIPHPLIVPNFCAGKITFFTADLLLSDPNIWRQKLSFVAHGPYRLTWRIFSTHFGFLYIIYEYLSHFYTIFLHLPALKMKKIPFFICMHMQVASNSSQHVELMLQESCTDPSGSLVVYTTIDVDSIQHAMSGEDPSCIPLLPIGFVIVPVGSTDTTNISGDGNQIPSTEDPGGNAPSSSSGCLLTIVVQVLASTVPSAKLNLSSVSAINNHLCNTVHQITAALSSSSTTGTTSWPDNSTSALGSCTETASATPN